MLLNRGILITPLVFCFSILGICLFQFPYLQKIQLPQQEISWEALQKDIKAEKLNLGLLKKMPSFGFNNLIADWVYINFLQYFGDDLVRDKTGYSLSPEYFEVIVERDPRFLQAYMDLSNSTSFYAAMPERSIALMNKGFNFISPYVPEKSYYAWRYKGIDELLFLGDAKASQQSFAKSANWANYFTDDESKYIANISRKTADFLSHNPDSRFARIATWAMILENKVDRRTRERAIQKITALGGKIINKPDGSQSVKFPDKD
jgi:hypothetical protein